jgi:hypothetical protein
VFTVEQRDALRAHMLRLAEGDARVTAAALVGSLAVGQAQHYIGAVRDHALALACLREGQTPFQARGYDDLSPETLAALEGSRVGSPERAAERTALAASVRALLREASTADLPHAATIADRLSELRDA